MEPSAELPEEPAGDVGDAETGAEGQPGDPRRRSPAKTAAASGVAAAFALGLRDVFDPRPVDTVGIEQEAPTKPTNPDDPDALEIRFDPMDSSKTVVVVRRRDPS